MPVPHEEIDWSLTTFDGVRREQLRRNLRLTLQQRLEAVEEMAEFARELHAALTHGAIVDAAVATAVQEPRPAYPDKSK